MLTNGQLQTLKAAFLANTDPAVQAAVAIGNATFLLGYYNADASPAVKAWRSSVPPEDSDEATPWDQFDNITQAGKRESWVHAFMRYPRDYTKASVRKWVTDVWGNATTGSNAFNILTTAGMRNITRAEQVLGGSATANRNDATAIKLTWEGPLTLDDVGRALSA